MVLTQNVFKCKYSNGVDPDPNSAKCLDPDQDKGNLCTLFVVGVKSLVLLVQHEQHLLHQLEHLLHI
jgi:hypothetical protein